MSLHRNRVQMTVTSVDGVTGELTLNAATTGYQSFSSAYGADATVDILITENNTWEVDRNCAYDNTNGKVTRGTLEASNTGSAVTFTSAAIVSVIATAASGNNWGLNEIQASPTGAGVTGVVGTMHILDISGLTADQDFTLPATCAIGDRVGVFIKVGDADHELLLKPASGDTINGGAGGAEWSRLFITGECVIFRCITADADWIVEYDGRIPQQAKMYLSTSADGESIGTYTRPTAAPTPGAWTDAFDNANITVPASDRIKTRRDGNFTVVTSYVNKDSGTTGAYCNLEIRINGTTIIGGPSMVLNASNVNRITAVMATSLVTNDYIDYYYRTADGNIGASGATTWACTLALLEQI